jgi:hypothetical protein
MNGDSVVKEILDFLGKLQVETPAEAGHFTEYKSGNPRGKLFAVDGGGAIIIDGGNWTISKIKVCAVGYESDRCISEFNQTYTLGAVIVKDRVKIKLDPSDAEVESLQIAKADFENATDLCRAELEQKLVFDLAKKLGKDDIILKDGLLPEGLPASPIFIGIAKSSRLRTETGRSLLGWINELAAKQLPNKRWYQRISDGEVIVKLHEKSPLCYRAQIRNSADQERTIASLAYFSSDPELIGYPYPLLKADKVARFRDGERLFERNRTRSLAKRMGINFIDFDESSTITHDLLDERAYR